MKKFRFIPCALIAMTLAAPISAYAKKPKKEKKNKQQYEQQYEQPYQQQPQYYQQQPQQYQQQPQYYQQQPQQYQQQPQQYQQQPQYYQQQPQQYQQQPQYYQQPQQYQQQPQQYQQQPQYYQQQPQPQYYQQAQSGIQYNQMPQQYQQAPMQGAPSADGFAEIEMSRIELLAYAQGTNELRAYGKAESANEQLAYNAARTQAINALQEKIEVYTRAGLDIYMDETGVNGEYSLDEKTRNQVITASKGVVNGAKIIDSRKLYNKQTKRYQYEICIGYDRAGLMAVMQAQSERILKNEKQFEQDMTHAWDALDAQNNRLSLGEQKEMRKNEMEQGNLDRQHQRDMQKSAQQNQHDLEVEKVKATAPKPEPKQPENNPIQNIFIK